MNKASPRRRAVPLVLTLAVGLVGFVPAPASAATWTPPKPREVTGVAVFPVHSQKRPQWTAAAREVAGASAVRWPAAGRATVRLAGGGPAPGGSSPRAAGSLSQARAGTLPVRVAAVPAAGPTRGPSGAGPLEATPGRVDVELFDRAAARRAGVTGVVLAVRRSDGLASAGAVEVTVDYRGFAGAYGGDWSSRLRLVTLPTGRPLPGRNDGVAGTVTARVPLPANGAATVAVDAGPASDNGDYTATSLSPSATWDVSRQTGDFSWSYPLRTPPATGGPEPALALSYSSGSVDGRTAGTNTQGSWLGDGWELWPGYIERSYRVCDDDKDAVDNREPNNKDLFSGDECWFNDNATLSLNGRATELVSTGDGHLYHGVTDDGSRVEFMHDGAPGNGDEDGTFWKVTTVDGTQYIFGRGHGWGGASDQTATDSVWTVPVYSNHPGEPGHAAGFAGSRHARAWRWNLDLVIDPHGNTITYFYGRETGAYGREGDPDKRTTYTRGGWLARAEYGSRTDAAAAVRPSAQILFDVDPRCPDACADAGGEPIPAKYPDTPWDQYCKAGQRCTGQLAPTFWTAQRLSAVRAQVLSGDGYADVESWTLRHTYLDAGTNEGKPMWLRGITRAGLVTSAGGEAVTYPEVVFDPGADPLANRVDDPNDGRSSLFRFRVKTITTESGAQLAVAYSGKECTRDALPPVENNTKACYPQYYGAEGESPTLDWFHKYRVTRVDVYDNTGGFAHEQTNYDYPERPAWHYDDSELVKPKKRTWGQYRGYGAVRVRRGLESGTQSAAEYRYFRGMDGDWQGAGKPRRQASVVDSQGTAVADHEAYRGMPREVTTLDGADGEWLSGTISTPTKRGPLAESGHLRAWMTNTGTERTRTRLGDGRTRWTRTVTTFNDDNLPTSVDDLGDEATPADDLCTRTWYARNGSNWMLDHVKRTERVKAKCAATPTLPDDLVFSSRTTYDKETNDWDTYLPVFGDAVKTEEIDSWTGGTPRWLTTGRSKYDANGRVVEAFDALNRSTKTDYTPKTAGPVGKVVTTDALGHGTTTVMAPAWQLPLKVTDPNGATTEQQYDGLGRLRRVWLPDRPKATNPNSPNRIFEYRLRNTASTALTMKTLLPLGNGYRTAVTLFDGRLRARQVQTQTPGGGRAISDTVYDSRGLLEWTSRPYYDVSNAPPDTTLVTTAGRPEIPALTENSYDGVGRISSATFKTSGNPRWQTTTTYGGDRTTVTPPQGGTRTETIVDGRGHTVERREYHSFTATTYDATTYTYTARGDLATVTAPQNTVWRYFYDQRGRRVREEGPDTGVTTSTYDAVGQLLTTKDAQQHTLAYTYDELGRRTSVRNDSVDGPVRAQWDYDTAPRGIGRLARSTRYEPAGSTTKYVTEVTGYDDAGRPKGSAVTIPASESRLCATGGATPCVFRYATTYRADGQVASSALPAAAGLPAETLAFGHTDVGLPGYLISGAHIYVETVTYDKLSNLTQRVLGEDKRHTWLTYDLDSERTGRLTGASAVPEQQMEVSHYAYEYDDAGNLRRIADRPNGEQPAETQCYRYDHLARLTEAWTPAAGACAPNPAVGDLGGPAPYWHSYTYDQTGNRKTEVRHATTDTTRTYTYPAASGAGAHPHAVSQIVTSGAATGTQTYGYDASGNTTCRPAGAAANSCPTGTGNQTLTWDTEGRLARSADTTGATTYVYDADGTRLIRRDPGGSTLYLPQGMEVRAPTTGTATGTRYYSHAGATVAVRTATGLTWLVNDHHGTGEATVKDADQSVTRRRTLPFGELRGAVPPAWSGDKGFVGGTVDNTGLTHLGAREYDPATGRFISADPVTDPNDPQQLNGYAYAHNSPPNNSDPTGLYDCEANECRPRSHEPTRPGGGRRSGDSGSGSGSGVRCNSDNACGGPYGRVTYECPCLPPPPPEPKGEFLGPWRPAPRPECDHKLCGPPTKTVRSCEYGQSCTCENVTMPSARCPATVPNAPPPPPAPPPRTLHPYGAVDACIGACLGIQETRAGHQLTLSWGGLGVGMQFGMMDTTPEDQQPVSNGACYAIVIVGPCGGWGERNDGSIYHQGGVTIGEGLSGGPTRSFNLPVETKILGGFGPFIFQAIDPVE